MANSAVKCVIGFSFTQSGKAVGWSEGYDTSFGTLAGIPFPFSGLIYNFVLARLYCLGTGVLNSFVKFVEFAPGIIVPGTTRRNTMLYPGIPPTNFLTAQYYNPALSTYPADYAQTTLNMKLRTSLTSTPVYNRSVWLAGIPDACDASNSNLPVAGPWNTAFGNMQSYFQGFFGNLIMIRSVDRSNANPIKPCTNVGTTGLTYTVTAHGFVQGQLVVAEGWRGNPPGVVPRGQYRVGVIDANTISLQGAGAATSLSALGGFRAVVYVWNACDTAIIQGFSKRNKGRPFAQQRGRRAVSRTRRS
jgi:hypothetical protein